LAGGETEIIMYMRNLGSRSCPLLSTIIVRRTGFVLSTIAIAFIICWGMERQRAKQDFASIPREDD